MTQRVMLTFEEVVEHWSLAPAAAGRLTNYLRLLLKWSAKINLVGAKSRDELVNYHLHDCLHLIPHLPGGSLVDVGSGAGLPCVIIACAQPDRPITAVEPTNKKIAFLRTVKRELELDHFTPIAQRVEHLEVGGFDVATSRATWPVPDWFERAAPLVRDGGTLVGMEGSETFELGDVQRFPYTLAGGRERAIVLKQLKRIED